MKNTRFENDILSVPEFFSKLEIVDENGEPFLKGALDIIDESGKLWDTYQVEIRGSENYPFSFPKLFETNNAFPKNADWHVYETDSSCCVDVPMSEKIICKKGLTVLDYIKQFAIPYFANQTHRFREGYYLYGEYAHGVIGRLQYYQSKLKPKKPKVLLQMLALIIKDYQLPRTANCPFCNKQKFRHCHRDLFKELAFVKSDLKRDFLFLSVLLKEDPNFKLPNI